MEVTTQTNPASAVAPRLAVVGMDIRLGDATGPDALLQVLFTGLQQPLFSAETRFQLEPQECTLFGLSGSSASSLDEENILLLKTAAGAMRDAGISTALERSAFLFTSTHQHLSENPRALPFQFPGVQMDFSGAGNPLAAVLIEAQRLLASQTMDYVVISAACLARNLLETLQTASRKQNSGPLTLGFDQNVDGWTIGEGAAAVVLMRSQDAPSAGKRTYAVLESFAWVQREGALLKKNLVPTFVSADTIQTSCRQAFDRSGILPQDIGSLDVLGSGFAPLDAAEITGLARAYQLSNPSLTCALGSLGTHSGYLFNAAGLAALVKTALCLYHRLIPSTPAWTGPKKTELWLDTPFYVNPAAKTWFLPAGASQRHAALNSMGWDGSSLHLILSETSDIQERPNPLLQQSAFYLFPIAGNSQAELLSGLNDLHAALQGAESPQQLAKAQYQHYLTKMTSIYALCITGQNQAELQREIELALKSLSSAFEQKKSWQTPLGSCFTPEPVGSLGEVAFVYPGGFNSYIGMGRDLFLLFPQLYERIGQLTAEIGATLQDEHLYPRSLNALTSEALAQLENELSCDPIAMITSGSIMAVLFTMIVRDIFKIKPGAALGYSLGEIAMLFGTGAWTQADAIRSQLKASPLFHSRLAGPQNAVRFAWGLPEVAEKQGSESLWSNYFVMAPIEKVAEALQDEPRVYLTHVNTPRQAVIGGDESSCQRVITRLKGLTLKAPFDFALHCKAIRSEYDSLVDLLTWPVSTAPALSLYTAAGVEPLPMDSSTISRKIADMMCDCIDFPALVRQVHADGARVFIELGPNANCTRWVEDTLKGSPCLAVSINRRGATDQESIVRMLARLVCHRVPLDLSPLYA
jgi:PfaB family protein